MEELEEVQEEQVVDADGGQNEPQPQAAGFPQHKVSITPGGTRYEIWFDQLTCFSHTIPDSQFAVIAGLLKDQRKIEAAQRIEIAHTMPKPLKRLN